MNTPEDSAALALRTASVRGKDQRIRHAQCAYFSAAFTGALQEVGRIRKLGGTAIGNISVTIDDNLATRINTGVGSGSMTEDTLRGLVAKVNAQYLVPLGVPPVDYQKGVDTVKNLANAMESQGTNAGVGIIIAR